MSPQERAVFPVSLVVTHLSGQGQESMFMGVLRPMPGIDNTLVQVRVVLCVSFGPRLCKPHLVVVRQTS